MRLSNVLLRIKWQRPDPSMTVSASGFEAQTDAYVVPRFLQGFHVVGNDQSGVNATRFILPNGRVYEGPGSNISTLFDVVAASPMVDKINDDEIHAWVFVEGEVVMRGRNSVEEWFVHQAGEFRFSDNPDNVLLLQWIRFLTEDECEDLETHMGQLPRR